MIRLGLGTLPWCLRVLSLDTQLLNVGYEVDCTEEDLEKRSRRLACLKSVVAKEVLVFLVLLQKQAHKVIVVLKSLNLAVHGLLHLLEHFGAAYDVLVDVGPVSEDMDRRTRVEVSFERKVKEAEELASLHNERERLLDWKEIL